ncbi:MAG: VCBS repeat-containing protein [Planctomycetes bacterium]|nr:VCBS repeat-containing protein [Planctomycetota bacterium]
MTPSPISTFPASQSIIVAVTAICVAISGVIGCSPSPRSNVTFPSSGESPSLLQFTSHGSDVGVDFRYQNGESTWLAAMIESNGGGIAIFDFDRDGRWDVFAPGGGRLTSEKTPIMVSNGFFQQTPSRLFTNVADRSGCELGVCYSFAVATADWDSDGFTDLFISGYNGQQLLKNLGDGTFEDATQIAGFHHRGWSSSAAWFDLENDGDLDLYISHYGIWSPQIEKQCLNAKGEIDRCAPGDFAGEPDELWINLGDGRFRDDSEKVRSYAYRGVGVVACDWDHDGDTDLYIANDEDPNVLLNNLGNGELQEIGAKSGTSLGSRNIVDGSMGLAVGDFDGNLKPDILVTNYQNEYCELYLNQGNQYFTLGTRSAGLMALGQAVVGWGTAFADVDHDGDEDLFVIAGHTSRRPIKSSNLQKPYLLENQQGKRLLSIGESVGDFFRKVHAGRGMAIGDLDNDGDIDLVASMLEQPIEIVRNDSKSLGNYLLIDLVGTQANRDATGAWVEADFGESRHIRHRIGGGSYASTHAQSLHLGLGGLDSIPSITIHWPGDDTQELKNVQANQRIQVIQGIAAEASLSN